MTDAQVDEFLARLLFRATLIRRVPHIFREPGAPQDEPYVDLAIASKAHYLVTRDKDLLYLRTGHTLLCKEFPRKIDPLKVVDPVEFFHQFEAQKKAR